MDGVADTPEKQDRYLKMIYNKANELDALINELSLYTNITNNAIPYEFHRVSVKDYFNDCMEEVRADLLSHNMTLNYNNYCAEDVKVVVDPDQLKRVINNIVTNAIKYTDKEEGHIDISIEESEKMIKVSTDDDGRGSTKRACRIYLTERIVQTVQDVPEVEADWGLLSARRSWKNMVERSGRPVRKVKVQRSISH